LIPTIREVSDMTLAEFERSAEDISAGALAMLAAAPFEKPTSDDLLVTAYANEVVNGGLAAIKD
jgi:hypothetical protein